MIHCVFTKIPPYGSVDSLRTVRPAAITARLTLSSNDANCHESTTTTYDQVVNLVLRRYANDADIAKTNEEIRIYKQGLLTPWDFFQALWDLTLRCGGVYNE